MAGETAEALSRACVYMRVARALLVAVVVLSALIPTAEGRVGARRMPAAPAQARDYVCDPATCRVEDKCHCASTTAPTGIPPHRTPQFITVTFDDNLHSSTYRNIWPIMEDRPRSANGCALHATFFISQDWTDYDQVNKWHRRGHEVACHTVTHTTDFHTSKEGWFDEMVGCRLIMSTLAEIPEEDIQGARAPFLHYGRKLFEVLHENGFRYESSIVEQSFIDESGSASWGSLLSTSRLNRIFPYTLDNGLGQTCTGDDPCFEPEWVFPGLFSIPMWTIDDDDDSMIAFMDYTRVDVLKKNFMYHYEGNRAPMGLFLHPRQYVNHTAIDEFLHWAATFDDVYFVNNIELLDWMDNPMDVDEMKTSFPCAGDEEAPLCDDPVMCTAGYKTCGQCPLESFTLENWREQMCDVGLLKQCAGDHCTCGAPGPGCTVGEWSSWSACDMPCGSGTQHRARDVVRDPGVASEACAYAASQSQSCNSRACTPVDCVMGEWGEWGTCDCGDGSATPRQSRSRAVVQPAEEGGAACPDTVEERACASGACPAACEVSQWGEWGSCACRYGSATPRQSRTRTVVRPAAEGGAPCPDTVEERTCASGACPTACEVSQWGAWADCSAACGGGVTTRTRSVVVEGIEECPPLSEELTCNEAACPVGPDPVACTLSLWSDWTACSAACGTGTRYRTRNIEVGAAHGGVCTSALAQTEACNAGGCGDATQCVACWAGTQGQCATPVFQECFAHLPSVGNQCPGGTEACATAPVHCEVSDWSPWGQCSAQCGGGVQLRTRSVATPTQDGGTACPPLVEERACGTDACDSSPQSPSSSGSVTAAGGAGVAAASAFSCRMCWPGTQGTCQGPNGLCYAPVSISGDSVTCPDGTHHCDRGVVAIPTEPSVRLILSLQSVALADLRATHKAGVAAALATALGVLPSQIVVESTAVLADAPSASAAHVRVLAPSLGPYTTPSAQEVLEAARAQNQAADSHSHELTTTLVSRGVPTTAARVEEAWLLAADGSVGGGDPGAGAGQEAGPAPTSGSDSSPVPQAVVFIVVGGMAVILVAVAIAVVRRRSGGSRGYSRVRHIQTSPAMGESLQVGPHHTSGRSLSTVSGASNGPALLSAASTPRIVRRLHMSQFTTPGSGGSSEAGANTELRVLLPGSAHQTPRARHSTNDISFTTPITSGVDSPTPPAHSVSPLLPVTGSHTSGRNSSHASTERVRTRRASPPQLIGDDSSPATRASGASTPDLSVSPAPSLRSTPSMRAWS